MGTLVSSGFGKSVCGFVHGSTVRLLVVGGSSRYIR